MEGLGNPIDLSLFIMPARSLLTLWPIRTRRWIFPIKAQMAPDAIPPCVRMPKEGEMEGSDEVLGR